MLKSWLDTRKRLWCEYAVPVTEELHTTRYMNGRSRISRQVPARHVHNKVEYWKDFGREVAGECLATIRSTEGLSVGAVWRRGDPRQLARTRQQAYAALIARSESEWKCRARLPSQLIQMADLVAWSANSHIDHGPGNEFAWNWYETYLAERDPNRHPQEI